MARRDPARLPLVLAWLVLLLPAWLPMPALAADDDDAIGRFRDWYAAAFQEGDRRVCYMVAQPTASAGDYSRRGAVYVQVTRRGGDSAADVVSFEAGYTFAAGAKIEVVIGGTSFFLFTEGETAWAYDDTAGDKALIAAMAKGSKMVVKGASARGTATTDTFSLMGFTAARRAMGEACGG